MDERDQTAKKMHSFVLINGEYTDLNGLTFVICGIEADGFNGDLFAVYASRTFFTVYLLFFKFEVTAPWKKIMYIVNEHLK